MILYLSLSTGHEALYASEAAAVEVTDARDRLPGKWSPTRFVIEK